MTTREEKLIAACTNAMIPCNGRFPMLLTMGTVLLRHENSVLLALILLAAVCVGASGSLLVSAAIGKVLRRRPDLAEKAVLRLFWNFLRIAVRG